MNRLIRIIALFGFLTLFQHLKLAAQDSSWKRIRIAGGSDGKYLIAFSSDASERKQLVHYSIRKKKGHKYITVAGRQIFLDFDSPPKYETDILALLKQNYKDSNIIATNAPIVFPAFLIDENGKILANGFSRNVEMDYYQLQIINYNFST
jgi:hypothetical protein